MCVCRRSTITITHHTTPIEPISFLNVVFCNILHLGGFRSMENTPTGCADELPAILGTFKNDLKSRSVNNCVQWLDFYASNIKNVFTSQSSVQTGIQSFLTVHCCIKPSALGVPGQSNTVHFQGACPANDHLFMYNIC